MADRSAIVLAGGASRRMGVDKASLVVDGVAMLDRVLAAVSAAGVERVVVVGPGHVADARPHSAGDDTGATTGEERLGPLAGIVGGWQALQDRGDAVDAAAPAGRDVRVLVVACDLPAIGASVLQAVLLGSRDHAHGAVAHDGERPQPLVAAYSLRAMRALTEAFHLGERSVRSCWDGWDLGQVGVDPTRVADADTPQDLAGFAVRWPPGRHGE